MSENDFGKDIKLGLQIGILSALSGIFLKEYLDKYPEKCDEIQCLINGIVEKHKSELLDTLAKFEPEIEASTQKAHPELTLNVAKAIAKQSCEQTANELTKGCDWAKDIWMRILTASKTT